jgi:hypothetical protein
MKKRLSLFFEVTTKRRPPDLAFLVLFWQNHIDRPPEWCRNHAVLRLRAKHLF